MFQLGDEVIVDCKEVGWCHNRKARITRVDGIDSIFTEVTEDCPAIGMVGGPFKRSHLRLQRDAYAADRLAGEFFGRLRDGLGFGELRMQSDHQQVVYLWFFKAKGETYRAVVTVEFFELLTLRRSLADMADEVIRKWKSSHNRVTE